MDLQKLRENIDSIDVQILELLNKRYEYVREVGKWKQNRSQVIYVPEREKELLGRLEKLNRGPLGTKALRAIYREIMSGALSLEYPLTIGYPYDSSSFNRYAAVGKFGNNVKCISCKSTGHVIQEIQAGRINYGIVPIENSLNGVVTETLDVLINSSVKICAEINVKSHCSLIQKNSVQKPEIIFAEKKIFEECSVWLDDNANDLEKVSCTSCNEAYEKMLSVNNSGLIANEIYAANNDLHISYPNIENYSSNITRFLILGNQLPRPTGDDKTSIFYSVDDRAGALCDALLPFKKKDIQITLLESRPSKKKNWEYYFFLDYLGHREDPELKEALDSLKKICPSLTILGSYPKSDDIL